MLIFTENKYTHPWQWAPCTLCVKIWSGSGAPKWTGKRPPIITLPSLYRLPEMGLVCRVQTSPTECTQTGPVMSPSAHSQASTAITWAEIQREREIERMKGRGTQGHTSPAERERTTCVSHLIEVNLPRAKKAFGIIGESPGGPRVIFQTLQNRSKVYCYCTMPQMNRVNK